MSRPIAVIGLPEEPFVTKVFAMRQQLLSQKILEEAESDTLPHLTILVNTALDDLVSNDFLAQKLGPLVSVLKQFTLTVTSFEKMDTSIVAKFDTSFTKKLVAQISSVLPGFRPVYSDFIKILRRVDPSHLDEALELVKKEFPLQINLDRISISGGKMRLEDLLWTSKLQLKN